MQSILWGKARMPEHEAAGHTPSLGKNREMHAGDECAFSLVTPGSCHLSYTPLETPSQTHPEVYLPGDSKELSKVQKYKQGKGVRT